MLPRIAARSSSMRLSSKRVNGFCSNDTSGFGRARGSQGQKFPTGRCSAPESKIQNPRSKNGRRPIIERLEGRCLLTLNGIEATSAVPFGSRATASPAATATPHQLGAAYQQVVTIQTTTLRSLGDSYRAVQAAGTGLADRAAIAIEELFAELRRAKNLHQAESIAAAIRRDRHILNLGGARALGVEQGLDVARGVADQEATADKTDIPNGLFTNLTELVRQAQSTGAAISRSGRRSVIALERALDLLGDRLKSTIG
jgi:hypothetical protein